MTSSVTALGWRLAGLIGVTAGLALSPLRPSVDSVGLAITGVAAMAGLAAVRPRFTPGWAPAVWLCLLALAAAIVGLAVGTARVRAIDGGALELETGARLTITGPVAAVPRREGGEVRTRVETPEGRLLILAPEPVPDLAVGEIVRASGVISEPGDWEADDLARVGVRRVLAASSLRTLGRHRAGPQAVLDTARRRAEAALGRGTSAERAALLRGFVLGQDDRIDPRTVEEFRRSGLAHLLAVSGQNVLLLALLAWPLLAALDVGRRARLVAILALIAVYVPIAGGGPSIQRAGVMGAAGIAAALAERPSSRWYVLLLAAAGTLALNPRASGDVGWQLSFAAVIGILLWSRALGQILRGGRRRTEARPVRDAIADGAALTVAATVATAPLAAQHFGVVSLVALPANLLALPAVAPVMWVGMLAGLAGQLPWLPVEPLTALGGVLAGYIAQLAGWLGSPSWAQADVGLGGPIAVGLVYAALAALMTTCLRSLRRRGGLRPRAVLLGGAILIVAVTGALLGPIRRDTQAPPVAAGLLLTVLDVGQGDAILLQPADGPPVLVDAGPADAEVATRLRELGVERLAAVAITHPQADHSGGVADVLAEIDVGRLLVARDDSALRRLAEATDVRRRRVAQGATLRSGSLRLEVLWPPPELLDRRGAAPIDDPNRLSLVLLARWGRFEALLTGDGEAEAAALGPGTIDVLKVAHHGSEDAGLERLLERTGPRLAVISVGEDNPYGHPAPATLAALEAEGATIARTDRDGDVTIEVSKHRWAVR